MNGRTLSGRAGRATAAAALAVALVVPAAPQAADDAPAQSAAENRPAESAPPPVPRVAYVAVVEAPQASGDLLDLLRRTSNLAALADQPPETMGGLERRINVDKTRLDAALRSEGYYAASVEASTGAETSPAETEAGEAAAGGGNAGDAENAKTAEKAKIRVRVVVDPGPLYRFAAATTTLTDEKGLPDDLAAAVRRDLTLPVGEPARAAAVVRGQEEALRRLRAAGHPYAAVDRQVIVDHDLKVMEARFIVSPGPAARFGPVVVSGDSGVDRDLILGRIPWREGDRYSPERLDKARKEIAALGAFDAVAVAPDLKPDRAAVSPETAVVPITVRTEPRLRRYIGASALYSSDDGAGVRAWWGHRNLFGRAERLRVDLTVARLGVGTVSAGGLGNTDFNVGALYEAPDFLVRNQDLRVALRAISENPAAYDRRAQTFSVGLERRLTDRLTARAVVEQDTSFVETNDRNYHVSLIGPAASLSWDRSNNPLDPTSGYRLTAELSAWAPFAGDGAKTFIVGSAEGRAYYDPSGDGGAVLAGRLNVASIVADGLSAVPPHRRLYAGGGASVRGYAFQMAGPRDGQNDPTGGLSRLDGGVEVRARVMENIAVVPFLDAAIISDRSFGLASGEFRAGGGLGVRYHTDFGPLRADLAFPFGKESNDSFLQLYISFGQAF